MSENCENYNIYGELISVITCTNCGNQVDVTKLFHMVVDKKFGLNGMLSKYSTLLNVNAIMDTSSICCENPRYMFNVL